MPTGVGGVELVDVIVQLEQLGIPSVWLGTGTGVDSLTLFAAAAARTQRIRMGSGIILSWPRHPVALAHQARALALLAPRRFTLGIGPGHQSNIEATYGIPYSKPLSHLREYVEVVRTLLHKGKVEFSGTHYRASASIPSPLAEVPVMISAVRARAFELAGEVTDGAITFLCPAAYLRDVAVPSLQRGAEKAGRSRPPLVANTPVCVHDEPTQVRQAVRGQLGFSVRPGSAYGAMLVAAGFPEAATGQWSDRMIEAAVVSGDEQQATQGFRHLFACGVTEVSAWPLPAGPDPAASRQRTLELVARLARSE
jgi:F420-dependent oxidoreductase-like protein